jgi:hypothetical protein
VTHPALFTTLLVCLGVFCLEGCGTDNAALLDAGRYREVLARQRAVGARGYYLRGRAYRGLGQLKKARWALRIAAQLAEDSARIQRELGQLEEALGALGAAMQAYQRAVTMGDQPSRRKLAVLLQARARLRLVGPMSDPIGAAADSKRSKRLAGAEPPPKQARRFSCPKRPRDYAPFRKPLTRTHCGAAAASALIDRFRRRALLLACEGLWLLRSRELASCPTWRRRAIRLLIAETPREPLYHLELARTFYQQAKPYRARLALEEHVYRSKRQAQGALNAARLCAAFGHRAEAGHWAVKAVALTRDDAVREAAKQLLVKLGYKRQARALENK